VDGCVPVLLYDIARHGARIPNYEDVVDLQAGLPLIKAGIEEAWLEGRGELTDDQVAAIVEWELSVTPEQGGQLAEQGKLEHVGLGQRWRQRMQDLEITPEKTRAKSTSKQRCIDSAASHLEGMGLEGVDITVDDHMLRFYDDCDRYNQVVGGPELTEESDKFINGQIWQGLLARVSARAGVDLDTDKVQLVWDMCRYERAWDPSRNSPWCALFTQDDLDIYNFRQDLFFYYLRGYAFDITAQQTQPLMLDVLQALQSSEYSYILNAAHSDTLAMFLTALGLYHDPEDLTAEDIGTGYQWDTSRIGSFSTNVEFVVFECPQEGRKTMMYHQEEAKVQPACGEIVCSVDQVVAMYSDIANADFDSICAAVPELGSGRQSSQREEHLKHLLRL